MSVNAVVETKPPNRSSSKAFSHCGLQCACALISVKYIESYWLCGLIQRTIATTKGRETLATKHDDDGTKRIYSSKTFGEKERRTNTAKCRREQGISVDGWTHSPDSRNKDFERVFISQVSSLKSNTDCSTQNRGQWKHKG